jgi:O-antigen/teichoic acid export membrane protein
MHTAVIRILRAQLQTPVFRLRHWSLTRMKSLLRFGGGMLSASALGMLIGPLNKAFISRYLGLGEVPTYEMAYSAASQFRSVGEAGVRALMPEVSRLGSHRDAGSRKAIWALNRRALILIVTVGLPVFLTVFAGSGILLKFWLGSRATVELQQSFRIMIAGTFLGLLGTPCYYTLVGLGNVRAVIQTYAALAVTNLATIGIGLTMMKMSVALAATGCALGMGVGTAYVIARAARLMAVSELASRLPSAQARGLSHPAHLAPGSHAGVLGRTAEDL